jgi:hypothetical protein
MGILGLSDMQKLALQVIDKKMKKRETVARAAQRWATEKVANKQKYFKVCVQCSTLDLRLTKLQPDVPGPQNG